MSLTKATSPLYKIWPSKAELDCQAMIRAIEVFDFERLGLLAENNALLMHATMQSAMPAVNYWTPKTYDVIQIVYKARAQGLPVFFTMDAGPNVKLLFLKQHQAGVLTLFPTLIVV